MADSKPVAKTPNKREKQKQKVRESKAMRQQKVKEKREARKEKKRVEREKNMLARIKHQEAAAAAAALASTTPLETAPPSAQRATLKAIAEDLSTGKEGPKAVAFAKAISEYLADTS